MEAKGVALVDLFAGCILNAGFVYRVSEIN